MWLTRHELPKVAQLRKRSVALTSSCTMPGSLAAWRGGLARSPGWIGLAGAAVGLVTGVGAAGWILFLGGLSLLASFAWH